MRSFSSDIIEKSLRTDQTIANDAEPYASFRIARNRSVLDNIDLVEKVRVRRLDPDTITDGDVAVCHPRYKGENTKIWCCYLDEGKLRVRWTYDQENITEAQAWMNLYGEVLDMYEALEDEVDSYILDQSELYGAFADTLVELDPEDSSIEYATNASFDDLAGQLTAQWNAMLEEIAEIKMQEASEENPIDVTNEFIANPAFEYNGGTVTFWTIATYEEGAKIGNNQGFQNNNTYTNGEVELNNFIEAWRPSNEGTLSNGTISQKIGVLPAGAYRLEVDAQALWQGDLPEGGVQGCYLVAYVGEEELSTSICIQENSANPEHFTLDFFADGETEVTIGLLVWETNANWMAADNFKLFSLGKDVLTAVESVKTENVAAKAIYSIDGRQQGQLRRGINIVRMADGNVRKVLVK